MESGLDMKCMDAHTCTLMANTAQMYSCRPPHKSHPHTASEEMDAQTWKGELTMVCTFNRNLCICLKENKKIKKEKMRHAFRDYKMIKKNEMTNEMNEIHSVNKWSAAHLTELSKPKIKLNMCKLWRSQWVNETVSECVGCIINDGA